MGPPAVPDVVYPVSQKERLGSTPMAYVATHLPPPLHTTGNRALFVHGDISRSEATAPGAVPNVVTQSPPMAAATGAALTAAPTACIKRAPVDDTMLFHCSACGKAFRKEVAALTHVRVRHPAGSNPLADRPTMRTAGVVATVLPGPGPGEVLGVEEVVMAASMAIPTAVIATAAAPAVPPTTTTATAPSAAAGGVTRSLASSTDSAPHRAVAKGLPVVRLPEDDLIEDILLDVWDAIALGRADIAKPTGLPIDPVNPLRVLRPAAGETMARWSSNNGQLFIPAGLVVEGKADRRAEMEELLASKPLARATPEGAAPGIKKRPLSSGLPPHRGAAAGPRMTLSIKELNKQHPNPFGDSPNAAILELEKEPVNPFMDLEGNAEAKPEHAAYNLRRMAMRSCEETTSGGIDGRPFVCPFCPAASPSDNADAAMRFRLLDALLDHIDDAHAAEDGYDKLSHAQWQQWYRLQAGQSSTDTGPMNGTATSPAVDAAGPAATAASAESSVTSETASRTDAGTTGSDSGSVPTMEDNLLSPEQVRVHTRCAANMVLVGAVRDIQEGFLGRDRVLQYVVAVRQPSIHRSGGTFEVEEEEEELIVVRCLNTSHTLAINHMQRSLHVGSQVLVEGSLRMNRHPDTTSRRVHAYPFVQVVPPLGSIMVLPS